MPSFHLRRILSLLDAAVAGGATAVLLALVALLFVKRLALPGPWPGLSAGLLLIMIGSAIGIAVTRPFARRRVNGVILMPFVRIAALLIVAIGPVMMGLATQDSGPDERESALMGFKQLTVAGEAALTKAGNELKNLQTKIQEGLDSPMKPEAYNLARELDKEYPAQLMRLDAHVKELATRRIRFENSPVRDNEDWVWVKTELPQYCKSLVEEVSHRLSDKPDGLQAKLDAPVLPGTKPFETKSIDDLVAALRNAGIALLRLADPAKIKRRNDILAKLIEENEKAGSLASETMAKVAAAKQAYDQSKFTDNSGLEKVRDEQGPVINKKIGELTASLKEWRDQLDNTEIPKNPTPMDGDAFTKEFIHCLELISLGDQLSIIAGQRNRPDLKKEIDESLTTWRAVVKSTEEQVEAAKKKWEDSKETDASSVKTVGELLPAQLQDYTMDWQKVLDAWQADLRLIRVKDDGAPGWLAVFLPHMVVIDEVFHIGLFGGEERTVAQEIAKEIANGQLPREGVLEDLFSKAKTPPERLALANVYQQILYQSPKLSQEDRTKLQSRLNTLRSDAILALSALARRFYDALKAQPDLSCDSLKAILGDVEQKFHDPLVKNEVREVIQTFGPAAMSQHWYKCLENIETFEKDPNSTNGH